MALAYPDVMNDLTDARHRFESGATQYLAEFANQVAPGGVVSLVLTLQSVTDAPINVRVDLSAPRTRGRLRRLEQEPFEISESVIRLMLQDGEVGQLRVPVRVHPEVPAGEYIFVARVESESARGATRRRPSASQNQIAGLNIRYPQGLGITQIASWGFETTSKRTQEVVLQVAENANEVKVGDVVPRFESAWLPERWDIVVAARREVAERRPYIRSELTRERVFVSLFQETPMWFSQSDLRLHVGEALLVAKILTATVTRLLSGPVGQECLLVPVFGYALANEQPTGDVLWLVTQLGFMHVLELAIASSFTLVENAVGRQVWTYAEQRAARDFIVASLNDGTPLPAEFLYLPLILGGLVVVRDLILEEEDVEQTIGLLQEARAERSDDFAGQEWRDLDEIYNFLVTQQVAT